jgi:hypothetical protein
MYSQEEMTTYPSMYSQEEMTILCGFIKHTIEQNIIDFGIATFMVPHYQYYHYDVCSYTVNGVRDMTRYYKTHAFFYPFYPEQFANNFKTNFKFNSESYRQILWICVSARVIKIEIQLMLMYSTVSETLS